MDLTHFRQKLEQLRQFHRERIDMIEETGLGFTSQGDQFQEDSTIDNHPADLGTEMFEREKDLGLLTNNMRTLREIDIAMERMARGEYGTCEECGGPIAPERLEVNPSATTCIECARRRERLPDRFKRPIEEQVLNPPFGRTFKGGSGFAGYDGEDAWQEVAQYGTSETPQDVPWNVTYGDMYDADQDYFQVVDPMDVIVDDSGEPLHREDWEETGATLFVPESSFRVGTFAHRTHYVPERRK